MCGAERAGSRCSRAGVGNRAQLGCRENQREPRWHRRNHADDVLMVAGGEGSGELRYTLNDSESGVLSNLKRLTINGRRGNNEISVVGVALEKNLIIRTRSGEDSIEVMSSTIGGRLTIVSGRADDELDISNSTVSEATWISTSRGGDQVNIEGLIAEKRFQLRTGAGTDSINLDANTFNNRLLLNTGNQDDELIATGNTSARRTQLNGASGSGDVYRQDEFNVLGSPYVFRGFEVEEMLLPLPSTECPLSVVEAIAEGNEISERKIADQVDAPNFYTAITREDSAELCSRVTDIRYGDGETVDSILYHINITVDREFPEAIRVSSDLNQTTGEPITLLPLFCFR